MSQSAICFAANRVCQRAAAPHPEAVLVELLSDALRLEGVLPFEERMQQLDGCLHQPAVGKDAAMARDAGVRVHRDQGVNGILGLDFNRPAALRAVAK